MKGMLSTSVIAVPVGMPVPETRSAVPAVATGGGVVVLITVLLMPLTS